MSLLFESWPTSVLFFPPGKCCSKWNGLHTDRHPSGNLTASIQHDYEFTDEVPFVGLNYYKLRHVGVTVESGKSPIVSAWTSLQKVTIYFDAPSQKIMLESTKGPLC